MASRPNKTASKRYQRIAKALMKDMVIVFVAGKHESKCNLWNRKLKRVEVASMSTAQAICDARYPWLIHCVITGRRQDGQQYMKVEYLESPHPVLQSQIASSCNDLHQSMMKDFNSIHTLTAAWVANPSGEEIEPGEIDQIITALGAYDFNAGWQ